MANLTAAAQFARLMDKRLTKVFEGKLAEYSSGMIQRLYNVMPGDSAFSEFYDIEAIGDIPRFSGTMPYLSPSPGYYRKIEPAEYGAAMSFERKLIDDKKYPVMDNRSGMLAQSMDRTREKDAARAFNYAFSAAFDYETSEEGVALCSSSHTTKVPGVVTTSGFSNAGSTALSKTAIAAARLAGKRFRMANGQLAAVMPDTLIVPESLFDTACEVTGYDPRSGASSELDPDTANRKINIARGTKVIGWNFLDDFSTKNWFMVDSKLMKQYLVWIDRVKPEFETRYDFNTKALEVSSYARWGYGFNAWQFIYGNQVS